MKTTDKLYLCQEDSERFYINAPDMETAKEDVIIWNAQVIKEVPRSYENKNPNNVKV